MYLVSYLDGGDTWAQIFPVSSQLASFGPTLFALAEGSLVASPDVGDSWEPVSALPFTTGLFPGLLIDDEGRAVVWDRNLDPSPRLARREVDGSWTVVAAPCVVASALPAGRGILAQCSEGGAVLLDEMLLPTEIDVAGPARPFGSSAVVLEWPGTQVLDVTHGLPFPVVATLPTNDRNVHLLSFHERLYWAGSGATCESGGTGVTVGVLSR